MNIYIKGGVIVQSNSMKKLQIISSVFMYGVLSSQTLNNSSMVIHRAKDRGAFETDWLKARYSFSFNNYYDPQKLGFGTLLVLNDDAIAPGKGFGKHPHDNMEIITIPLEGAIKHEDSEGNHGVVGFGEVQVMSAGTGIRHSEYNHSATEPLKLFQIWIKADKRGHKPRYDQKKYDPAVFKDTLFAMVSPHDADRLQVHQNATLSMGIYTESQKVVYAKKDPDHGVYLMVIEGTLRLGELELGSRDAVGIDDKGKDISLEVEKGTKLLVIEVPMQ